MKSDKGLIAPVILPASDRATNGEEAMLSDDRLQHILACLFGLGLILSGIMRRGMGVRGFPEVSEQNDPPPVEFSIALIVLGFAILGYGALHLLLR